MSFEVVYRYCERNEDGSYNRDEIKEMKKKVGTPYEEVPYNKLAGTIMGQLARRDVWTLDFEVYEYVKKKINAKESGNALIIGHKKYTFDECGSLGITEVHQEPTPQPSVSHVPQRRNQQEYPQEMLNQGNINVADLQLLKKRPLRYEIFQPDPDMTNPSQWKHLAFTIGQHYSIYEEKSAGMDVRHGMKYTTLDNQGRKQILSDKFFIPVPSSQDLLINNRSRDIPLSDYGEIDDSSMPVLR